MAQRSDPPSTTEGVSPPEEVTAPAVLSLAAGFPQADREQWQELVAGVLRRSGLGAASEPVEDALRTSVGSGVQIAPLYVAEDGADLARHVGVPGLAPFVRGSRAGRAEYEGWDVRARHAHPDVEVTRQAIAADLDNGATSLWLVLGQGAIPIQALPEVLDGVLLDVAPVVLQAGSATSQVADAFFDLAASTGVEAGELLGNLGADPYGDAIRTGADADLSAAVSLARRCHDGFPLMHAITVDSTVFHDAGAEIVEELGCSLAAGVGYLRALTDDGLDVDSALAALDFRYSAGGDQFLTVAAFRAARRLWNRVGEVSGASASASVRGQRQHAVTSSVMMTRRDPWVNMLRTTVACFAAGIGGADAVTVAPFDSEIGLSDSFARRIARNTQTLLMEEGNLARVLDPAGGSWYIESLTDQLATAAWDWFTEIERAGGLVATIASGMIADRIASVWAVRRDRLAHRNDPITGVSEFPNLTETLPVREPHPSVKPGSRRAALPVVRAAEEFETLRDRVDTLTATQDSRPAVFLATLGSIAASTPRASFAANLFQAAGFDTPSNGADGGENAAIVSAFVDAGTPVVCLCGTDRLYAERAAALVDALVTAGATQVLLAGSHRTTGDVAGIDGYVFAGCNALEVLGRALDELAPAEGDEPS